MSFYIADAYPDSDFDLTRKLSALEAEGVLVWHKPEILYNGIYQRR